MVPNSPTLIEYPSRVVILTLFAILAASLWVFIALIRRETIHRRVVALAQWAAGRGLRMVDPKRSGDVQSLLPPLAGLSPRIHRAIAGGALAIAQVDIDQGHPARRAESGRWNLLLRRLEARWPITGLRPTVHTASIADLFSLSSYPSLTPTERFMIFGSEARAARTLAESSAIALLPADVGLLVNGEYLILDFTSRPFDEIEFGRMIDLAEQLGPRLAVMDW